VAYLVFDLGSEEKQPMSTSLGKLNRWFEYSVIPLYTSPGLTKRTITLEVTGRKSGKPHEVTVTTVLGKGFRYLVSVHGESHWVRNVRAANGQAVLLSGGKAPVRLVEIPIEERAPILFNDVRRGAFGQSSVQLTQVFGVESYPTVEEMKSLANQHPVFGIEFSH
jgi:hypothetical protein